MRANDAPPARADDGRSSSRPPLFPGGTTRLAKLRQLGFDSSLGDFAGFGKGVGTGASVHVEGRGFGPQSGKLSEDIERYGADSAQATARLQRIFLVSRIELVFLLLVVLDMALKPGS